MSDLCVSAAAEYSDCGPRCAPLRPAAVANHVDLTPKWKKASGEPGLLAERKRAGRPFERHKLEKASRSGCRWTSGNGDISSDQPANQTVTEADNADRDGAVICVSVFCFFVFVSCCCRIVVFISRTSADTVNVRLCVFCCFSSRPFT